MMRTSRRSLLRAAGAAGLGALGVSLLAACRPNPGSTQAPGQASGGASPTVVPGAPITTAPINTHSLTGAGSGGTLRIGMTASNVPIPDTPTTEGGEGSRFVGTQIYEGLTRYNTNQSETSVYPVPGMAESWSLADDQVTWTFKLRQGQKYHDGTPFNADSVKFGLDRVFDKNFEYYNPTLAAAVVRQLSGIGSYTPLDDSTFQIVTNRPYAFLLWDLQGLYLPSPTAVKTYGPDYVQHAAGTGPFRMTKYVDGQVMELEPNDGYWQGKPKLDKLVLSPMPEPASRLAGLQAGDIDWAEVPPPDAVAGLKADGFQVMTGPYPHVITYQMNMYKPPLNDVRVRQALNYAVDRDATIAVISGFGIPAHQYIHKGHPYYDDNWEGYSYDLDRARSLLADAGYARGFKLRMVYPPSGSGNMWPGPMNERLKADFAAVGVDVELIPIEWNNIMSANRAGLGSPDWQGYDMIHISTSLSTPVSARTFTTSGLPPAGCCNPSGYSNPVVDAAFADAERTFDQDQQNALIRKTQSTAMQDGFAVVTVHDLNLRVLSSTIRNFVEPQAWTVDLYNVYMDQGG
ncbi:MAG: ABC transporter substrate-binding protein [Mycobacterium sp.]|nr:ABC transporter substrate-binding protein [Mycobacterium sp.]